MCGEHVLQVRRHGVGPEEVVIQSVVAVYSLVWIEDKKFVDQVQGVRVFDVELQSVFNFPLLSFG